MTTPHIAVLALVIVAANAMKLGPLNAVYAFMGACFLINLMQNKHFGK